jgi:DNA-directed RNA polymerase subunit H (RpoH/RPB5)
MIDLKKLSHVYKTTLEMLYDRSYDISEYYDGENILRYCDPDDNDTLLSNDDKLLLSYNKNNLKIMTTDLQNVKTCVFFYQTKIGINEVKKIIEFINDEEITHLILIMSDPLTTYAVKEMKNNRISIELEIFYDYQMIYNVTKHILVPTHELLDEKHTKLIFKKFGKKIPLIKSTDRISRYYNAKPNQIFKIYRKNNELFFRLVV